MSSTESLSKLEAAIAAQKNRNYYSAYPENLKAYDEDAAGKGLAAFQKLLNNNFTELQATPDAHWVGEEVSPYMRTGLGIQYPAYSINQYISQAQSASEQWQKKTNHEKAQILIEALDNVALRFFEIAYATMHTTGQSFVMSFQASGPHANDRALEVIGMAYEELNRFVKEVNWTKPMGKFDLQLRKTFNAIPKGIGLVIGCSTFPTWNTVPGLFANLMAGNPSIVKPHPKSILPIAIVVAEIQKTMTAHGIDANICQLAPDTLAAPVTKLLAEHSAIKLIDYTGGSAFGDYIESLNGKTTFTEKAGVNSIVIESTLDMDAVASNIAFSVSLYSGQMCTAPQNIFVSKDGINTSNGNLSFDEVAQKIADAVKNLAENPKMGPFTLGAIQNEATRNRVEEAEKNNTVLQPSLKIVNPEFSDANVMSPAVMICDASETGKWRHECFGPAIFIIKTDNADHSLELAATAASELGAITCSLHTVNKEFEERVILTMNKSFTPVSVNFTGAAFVNQHAAFSDLHVSGGNPSGNAGFTNPEYVNKRWVWIGNRYSI